MHRQRFRIVEPLQVALRRNEALYFIRIDYAAKRIVVALGECVGQLPRPTDVFLLVHANKLTLLQIAINIVFRDTVANFVLRQFRKIPELPRPFNSELLLGFEYVLALPTTNQSATSARRTEPDAFGLKQDDTLAEFGKVECGRQSGKSATDDTDIGGKIFLQRWPILNAVRGRYIPAIGITPAVNSRYFLRRRSHIFSPTKSSIAA